MELIGLLQWTKCEKGNTFIIYFQSRLLGRENTSKFKFMFTLVYWGEKINLNVLDIT